ncbi:hypothetical protein ABZ135_19205 [Streptomyces sp. NPDC006339]|uniref:hypothetical protein n=1 Tax=Streptomyces sp. NPDC006339 TaxID=3156755 RepID=UPI0033BF3AF2
MLLPLAGHALSQGHAPRWLVVVAAAVVAVPGAAFVTRRRLTDTQLLGAFAASQLAYHVAYSVPGACAAMPGRAGATADWSWFIEYDAVAGPPMGVLLASHLITVLLAARLLGVSEQLLWQGVPLLEVVHRALLFLWPLLGTSRGTGPRPAFCESTSPLRSSMLARLHEGRAPPRQRGVLRKPFTLLRPMPIGGPCLP